jgi:hypothetical protein
MNRPVSGRRGDAGAITCVSWPCRDPAWTANGRAGRKGGMRRLAPARFLHISRSRTLFSPTSFAPDTPRIQPEPAIGGSPPETADSDWRIRIVQSHWGSLFSAIVMEPVCRVSPSFEQSRMGETAKGGSK